MSKAIAQSAQAIDAPADAAVMDSVLNLLNLPKELSGQAAEPASKEDTSKGSANGAPADRAPTGAPAGAEGQAPTEEELCASLSEEDKKALQEMPEAERAEILRLLAEEEAKKKVDEEEPTAPQFTAEQQEYLKAQEEAGKAAAKELQDNLDTAQAQVQELTAKLSAAQQQPFEIAPVHPLLFAESDADIAKTEAELRAFERWATTNWDGTEEQTDKNGNVTVPAYSKEAIRERYSQIKEMREALVPKAREDLARRTTLQTEARKAYPELFNPKTAEYATATNLLKAAPGLRAVLPNIFMIIGDAIAGERARLARSKNGSQNGSRLAKLKERLPASRKPAAGLARTPAASAAAANGKTPPTAKRFMELGGNRSALVAMLRDTNLPSLSAGPGE